MWAIILVSIWQGVGFQMVILLAALFLPSDRPRKEVQSEA